MEPEACWYSVSIGLAPESRQKPLRRSWRVDQADYHSLLGRFGFLECRRSWRSGDHGRLLVVGGPDADGNRPCHGPALSTVLLPHRLVRAPLPCGSLHRRRLRIPAACSDSSPSQTSRRSGSPENRNDQTIRVAYQISLLLICRRRRRLECRLRLPAALNDSFNGLLPTVAFPSLPVLPCHPLTEWPWGIPFAVCTVYQASLSLYLLVALGSKRLALARCLPKSLSLKSEGCRKAFDGDTDGSQEELAEPKARSRNTGPYSLSPLHVYFLES